ncbi:MAG: hypothetical protein QNJ54_32245 [Prochloraceae cyanobacterium]|nr:hypothetical protein [Prochloraceae cyanobacterium]
MNLGLETNTTVALSFLEQPTGLYAVGTTSYYFVDPKREETYTKNPNDNREITAKVWYPSKEVPGAVTESYIGENLSRAIASQFKIPPQDFVNLTENLGLKPRPSRTALYFYVIILSSVQTIK